MHPIRHPEILDRGRDVADDRRAVDVSPDAALAGRLADVLRDTAAYAEELWQHLDAARRYLWDSLPSDPRAPGGSPHAGASPTGPGDEEGWQRWMQTYSRVTSVLAGPRGDNGFGHGEAMAAARDRRQAPNLAVLARRTQPFGDARRPNEAPPVPPRVDRRAEAVRALGLGALIVLAARGLRPRSAPRA